MSVINQTKISFQFVALRTRVDIESKPSRFISDTCIICHLPEIAKDKLRRVTATGLQTIITYSQLFNVIDLERDLLQNAHDQHLDEDNNPVQIHISCQKTIGNEIRKKKRPGSAANVQDVPTAIKIRRRSYMYPRCI